MGEGKLHKNIVLDMTSSSVINAFNDKFKARNEMKYQKKIDKMINQIDIALDHKFWKKYIENSIIIGYTDCKEEDSVLIIEHIIFKDEILVYFIYQIALELSELALIKLNLKVFKDDEF